MTTAVRRADVYVGRVDKDVTADDIKSFIEQTFDTEAFSVSKLDILSDIHNVLKVGVETNVRDRLFDSDKWPEDILCTFSCCSLQKNIDIVRELTNNKYENIAPRDSYY